MIKKYQLTERELNLLWDEAIFISHVNDNKGFRQDEHGQWIRRSEFGNPNSEYGWSLLRVKNSTEQFDISDYIPCHWRLVKKQELDSEKKKLKLKMLPLEDIAPEKRDSLWLCGQIDSKANEEKGYRVDIFGQWIGRHQYGDLTSPFGWCVVLVDISGDLTNSPQWEMLPINLGHMQELVLLGQTDDEGWTAWDTVGCVADAVESGFGILASSVTLPFSFLE
ncbi:hypothetical protein EX227_19230 [Providencia rettgeri]|uniref:Uncharacterized protein n=1 Tax=Providencia rettgeri TaxID=587 RepID=A0AAP2K1C2_PRORE|nr:MULTISPECIES: hypothetical protein [Providencia]EIU7556692.1 hypothetical protein [Providencia rettgeri]EJD6499695.1 hypothetical protein [Providencia rettgeri]EJD6643997.1 hypothetical protein [Providencia rettgeri]ELL9154575.1 hypothetical protein [Providencia rettgeri]ELR5049317.1 hypothetical protein [Providencia rettgeri]